jgi:hypothetical protein
MSVSTLAINTMDNSSLLEEAAFVGMQVRMEGGAAGSPAIFGEIVRKGTPVRDPGSDTSDSDSDESDTEGLPQRFCWTRFALVALLVLVGGGTTVGVVGWKQGWFGSAESPTTESQLPSSPPKSASGGATSAALGATAAKSPVSASPAAPSASAAETPAPPAAPSAPAAQTPALHAAAPAPAAAPFSPPQKDKWKSQRKFFLHS